MDDKDLEKKRIGLRIKQIRSGLGLTMKEFGKKFNPPASDSIVSRWERGVSVPNNERLKKISELGNISTFYLMTGKKSIYDLTEEERMESVKNNRLVMDEIKKENEKRVKEELQQIISNKLNSVETIYFAKILEFLKLADAEDIVSVTSIFSSLNTVIKLRIENSIEKGEVSEEELDEFIETELKEIEAVFLEIYYKTN